MKRNLPKVEVAVRPGTRSQVVPSVLTRWAPDLKAAASDDAEATISILDPIGADLWGEGVTARRISAALRSIGDRDVVVNVNSPGGDLFEGTAIYNLLREHKGHVTVRVLGLAASAASVIAMAGDEVQIARAGFLMIHNAWVVAAGDRNALRDVSDWLAQFDEVLADVYNARTGIDRGELSTMLDRETWLGGQAAVDQGFADGLLPSDAVSTDPANGGGTSVRAEKKFDLMAQAAGVTRSAASALLREIKDGVQPGADLTGQPGAAETEAANGVVNMLKNLK